MKLAQKHVGAPAMSNQNGLQARALVAAAAAAAIAAAKARMQAAQAARVDQQAARDDLALKLKEKMQREVFEQYQTQERRLKAIEAQERQVKATEVQKHLEAARLVIELEEQRVAHVAGQLERQRQLVWHFIT
jgi:ribosomal protein L16 Arg81 hydroxylase